MPKVSVLMGAYNCADTIAESIESIQGQTFTDWEMIICDDGSKDNTVEVVQSYVEKDNRIKLIRNEKNHGLSYTLNRCIENSTGEYCARMDGDDLCDPERFAIQNLFLDTHPEFGFVSTTMLRFDDRGVYQRPKIGDGFMPTKADLIKGSPFCHAPSMIRRSTYDAVNGYRDLPQILGDEDYDLWFRIYAVGISGYVIENPLYSMRDGREAAKRRSFRRRLNEAWVRKEGYKAIGTPIYKRLLIIKPILIGLIPQCVYRKILR